MRLQLMIAVSAVASAHLLAQFPPQIKNIVIIVQENRTPDNLFHFLSPACPIPRDASGLAACTPYPVTDSCYNISPCGISNQSGTPVAVPLKARPFAGGSDPNHSHKGFSEMCDLDPVSFQCRNDGAWRIAGQKYAYAYVANTPVKNSNGAKGHLLDPYLQLAEQFGWANYMFQSNQGPSFPAHQFIFSGTSALSAADDANATFVSGNPGQNVSSVLSGCLAPQGATNVLLSPVLDNRPTPGCTLYAGDSVQECVVTNTALSYPSNPVGTFCATHQSMGDVLSPAAVSWRYYSSSPGVVWTAPDAIQSICQPAFVNPDGNPGSALECAGDEFKAHVDVANHGTDILRDISNCNLAQVSWVTPDGAWSDHAGPSNLYGPSWVAAVVNALGHNQKCPAGTAGAGQTYWQVSAILITWDDWGGWSDHERPPLLSNLPCTSSNCPGDYGHGFRVPLLVVSAYTPAGYIDNTPHDFGSILRMIEGVNNLQEGVLGFADLQATTDLHEFFSLSTPREFSTVPAQKSANYFLTDKAAAIQPDDD